MGNETGREAPWRDEKVWTKAQHLLQYKCDVGSIRAWLVVSHAVPRAQTSVPYALARSGRRVAMAWLPRCEIVQPVQ